MKHCNQVVWMLALVTAMLPCIVFAEEGSLAELWSGTEPFPVVDDIELIGQELVRYQQIHTATKPITFAIGAALINFNGIWHASWAANPDGVSENLGTEHVTERISSDNAHTWSEVRTLAPQLGGEAFHSHGSFLIHKKKLYFFAKHGPFSGPAKVFKFGPDGKSWKDLGLATNDATFWPMDEAQQMGNGQWIMGGLGGKSGKLPAVAVANDDNILEWEIRELPIKEFKGFGETTVITKGNEVLAISRNGAVKSPMVNRSTDAGATWSGPLTANIAMVAAKPYAGRLADGRPFLICNVPAQKGAVSRSRLCLLLGAPRSMTFDRVWLLRPGDPPAARFSGPQHKSQWAYPYAHEHKGALYIAHHNAKEDVELIVVQLSAMK